ncbi:MAG: protein translocase subunit SecF [Candidatus Berkelbacteria bacterium]|nr:protein translocase subunit SecF [Candidatus Berkelbacteria bacterium]
MDIIGKRKIFYIISGAAIVISIISLIFWGLSFGIDFKGGTLIELDFNPSGKEVDIAKVKEAFSGDSSIKSLSVQKTGKNSALIKAEAVDKEKYNSLKDRIREKAGDFREERFETVGPTVSKDLQRKAFLSVGIASLAIIIYLAIAFRRVPKPANSWRFGITAVVALLHDLLIVTGLFSILGHFYSNIVVDSLFVTALLTILGFSVHDTIVVFDRIRENLRRMAVSKTTSFSYIANESIKQTIARSINTSLTVLIALFAILIFGGQSIFAFVLALIVGIIVGTYSSVFVAAALLVDWTEFAINRAEK